MMLVGPPFRSWRGGFLTGRNESRMGLILGKAQKFSSNHFSLMQCVFHAGQPFPIVAICDVPCCQSPYQTLTHPNTHCNVTCCALDSQPARLTSIRSSDISLQLWGYPHELASALKCRVEDICSLSYRRVTTHSHSYHLTAHLKTKLSLIEF